MLLPKKKREKEERGERRGEGKLGEGEEEGGKMEREGKKKGKRKEMKEEEGRLLCFFKKANHLFEHWIIFSSSFNIYGLRFYVSVIIKITKKIIKTKDYFLSLWPY